MIITRLISRRISRGSPLSQFSRRFAPIEALGVEIWSSFSDDQDFQVKYGVLRHSSGFSTDSSSFSSSCRSASSRRESSNLHKGCSFFSTASRETTDGKPVEGSGKQIPNGIIKEGSVDEEIADAKILRSLVKYLWLNDNFEFRMRVVLALSLLVGAKVINVQVPFLFKLAVDWISASAGSSDMTSFTDANSTLLALFVSPAAVLVGYGIARAGASACSELRNAVFSKVALRAIRTVSKKVFSHLHDLDLRYHLSEKNSRRSRRSPPISRRSPSI